jgi:predicted amidophosphoribosyltransferase
VISRLIEQHGWHVLGELATLVIALIVAGFWIRALIRGRAKPTVCGTCGRVSSRATAFCPRCGEQLAANG